MASPDPSSPSPAAAGAPLDPPTAFAAVALAAVSWDGVLTVAGTRALRHELDYRPPYKHRNDQQMIALMDRLLAELRRQGVEGLMRDAAGVLDERQRHTAYAVAAEIMRSDGPLAEREQAILARLAESLGLSPQQTGPVLQVMDVLHADVLGEPGGET
jgi:uncharacterized tellurite resistance protein B-like protein